MSDLAWSYSRLKTFEECPKKFYHLNVKKDVRDAPSEAMEAGTRDHKSLELRIKSGNALPAHLASLEPLCQVFDIAKQRGHEVLTECQWAFTRDFQPTGWFDKNVWVRVILDAGMVGTTKAIVIDWKTGKRNPDWDQLKLFAASAFLRSPDLKSVTAQFIWTKDGSEDSEIYEAGQAPDIWAEFLPRVERLQEANRTNNWPKTPNRLCGWCPLFKQHKCTGDK